MDHGALQQQLGAQPRVDHRGIRGDYLLSPVRPRRWLRRSRRAVSLQVLLDRPPVQPRFPGNLRDAHVSLPQRPEPAQLKPPLRLQHQPAAPAPRRSTDQGHRLPAVTLRYHPTHRNLCTFACTRPCTSVRTPTPGAAKALGRAIRGYDEEVWAANRYGIVVEGNIAKFGQNPPLLAYLISTAGRILVEASPEDRVWGIGLAAVDGRVGQPSRWRGLNLLGFALMDARERLAEEGQGPVR